MGSIGGGDDPSSGGGGVGSGDEPPSIGGVEAPSGGGGVGSPGGGEDSPSGGGDPPSGPGVVFGGGTSDPSLAACSKACLHSSFTKAVPVSPPHLLPAPPVLTRLTRQGLQVRCSISRRFVGAPFFREIASRSILAGYGFWYRRPTLIVRRWWTYNQARVLLHSG